MRRVDNSLLRRLLGTPARTLLIALTATAAAPLDIDRARAATVTVNDLGDVAVAGDSKCTLREAILTTNTNEALTGASGNDCPGGENGPVVVDIIDFGLALGVQTLTPSTPLPSINDQVEIDGRNGTASAIRIEIDGNSVPATGSTETGLRLLANSSDGSVLHHLAVFGFPDDGIELQSDGNMVTRTIVGMDQDGVAADANGRHGILISGDENVVFENTVSGNAKHGIGIDPIASHTGAETALVANRIGTNKSGAAAVANGEDGVNFAPDVTTGEGDDLLVLGNLISGNTQSGIQVSATGTGSDRVTGLEIAENFVGTDDEGLSAIPNSPIGSEAGIKLAGPTKGALIEANLVSGNGDDGILLQAANPGPQAGPTDTTIAANDIGLDAEGDTSLPNDRYGIKLDRSLINGPPLSGTTIGGTFDPTPGGPCDGDCNLISGNGQTGIVVFDADTAGGPIADTEILGNYIGTDVSGAMDRGNFAFGVMLSGASEVTIGQPGSPNVLSGNGASGVDMLDDTTTGNTIQANLIGLAANGSTPLGNDDHGIEAGTQAVSQNMIGGIGAGLGNRIAHNGDAGVMLGGGAEPVADMPVLGNSIFANGGLGIDLRPDLITGGVTENGACNVALVANRCQEFPVVSTAGGSTLATGTLHSDPGKSFRIEAFASLAPDPSGNGEGERFLGAITVTTNGAGDASWTVFDASATLAAGEHVAATATEVTGNGTPLSTSEFSDSITSALFAPPTPPTTPTTPDNPSPPSPAPAVKCNGKQATVVGTTGKDTLKGTGKRDVIAGLGGKDTIKGFGGNDLICGGDGDDTLKGGSGKDELRGDAGKDSLNGGSGSGDSCNGGSGRDKREAPGCETSKSLP